MASLGARWRAAVGLLVPWGSAVTTRPPRDVVDALAVFPVVGAALGALAAAVAWLGGLLAPWLGGVLGVATLLVLARGQGVLAVAARGEGFAGQGEASTIVLRRPPTLRAVLLAVALWAVKVWAGVALSGPARLVGFVLASILGAWAVVVQCYGGAPAPTGGSQGALVGRAGFGEFGWASLLALGATMAVAEAVGLLVVLVAALVTVGLRLYAYRRAGGMNGRLLAATRELVETLVLATLAALASGRQ